MRGLLAYDTPIEQIFLNWFIMVRDTVKKGLSFGAVRISVRLLCAFLVLVSMFDVGPFQGRLGVTGF